MGHGVRLRVLSSVGDGPGTMVVDEDEIVEQQLVSGIAYSRDEAKITLLRVPDRPGIAANIFGPLAEGNINRGHDRAKRVSGRQVHRSHLHRGRGRPERAVETLEAHRSDLPYTDLVSDPNVVKISVIGVGMRSHAGVAQRMFRVLADRAISIQAISTSEIKISVLISEERLIPLNPV